MALLGSPCRPLVAAASRLPTRSVPRSAPSALHRSQALAAARGSLSAAALHARQRTSFAVARTAASSAADEEDEEPWEIDLQVTGMVCEGCVANVAKALEGAKVRLLLANRAASQLKGLTPIGLLRVSRFRAS